MEGFERDTRLQRDLPQSCISAIYGPCQLDVYVASLADSNQRLGTSVLLYQL